MSKSDALIAAAIGEATALFFHYFLGSAQNQATGAFYSPNRRGPGFG